MSPWRRTLTSGACLAMLAGLFLAAPRADAGGGLGPPGRPGGRRPGLRGGAAGGRGGRGGGGGGPIAVIARSEFEAAYLQWNLFYKRSLLATSSGVQEAAKVPMSQSRERWYGLLEAYYRAPPPEFADDRNWREDLAAITGYLHVAEWQLHAGRMRESHESLERVRWIWLNLRERNNVQWFGDEVTRYHAVMEPVVKWGTGEARGGVTAENMAEFEAEFAKLLDAWRRLAKQRPPPGNMRRFQFGMQREAAALGELQEVIADRWYPDIPEASKQVKTAFMILFMGFG